MTLTFPSLSVPFSLLCNPYFMPWTPLRSLQSLVMRHDIGAKGLDPPFKLVRVIDKCSIPCSSARSTGHCGRPSSTLRRLSHPLPERRRRQGLRQRLHVGAVVSFIDEAKHSAQVGNHPDH